MGNFNKYKGSPFANVEINPAEESHISIMKPDTCLDACENKPCTYYCPTRVYWWEDNMIQVDYTRCIECNACPYGCPHDNIAWEWPPGGYGVNYKMG
ncbi:MAG: 4Fe-4S dicluster domain-containing protein [Halanaerobium sp.]|nr:4Fe-4S dicluster domain-containing protein [Halanaerobium sp.]